MKMRKIPRVILDHKKRYYPGVKSADQLFFDPRTPVTLVTQVSVEGDEPDQVIWLYLNGDSEHYENLLVESQVEWK